MPYTIKQARELKGFARGAYDGTVEFSINVMPGKEMKEVAAWVDQILKEYPGALVRVAMTV